MRKINRLILLMLSLWFVTACADICSIKPSSDCVDVPCIPCVFPFPVYPMNTKNNNPSREMEPNITSVDMSR